MVSVFITAEELKYQINSKKPPILVDARWHDSEHSAFQEFLGSHLPGAHFFDLEVESDLSSSIPHAMPKPPQMARMFESMNIGKDDSVVVYEYSILCTSARFWFMLRVYGFNSVRILSGGIKSWVRSSYNLESGPAKIDKIQKELFPIVFQADRIVSKKQLDIMMKANKCQLIDVRSKERFNGEEEESREGLNSGCVPNSINIPFLSLSTQKTQISIDAFKTLLEEKKIDLQKPIVTMCGSGVTACILIAMFEEIGINNIKLYDGSWAEWGLATV